MVYYTGKCRQLEEKNPRASDAASHNHDDGLLRVPTLPPSHWYPSINSPALKVIDNLIPNYGAYYQGWSATIMKYQVQNSNTNRNTTFIIACMASIKRCELERTF